MNFKISLLISFLITVGGCASQSHLKYEKEQELSEIVGYDKQLEVKEIPVEENDSDSTKESDSAKESKKVTPPAPTTPPKAKTPTAKKTPSPKPVGKPEKTPPAKASTERLPKMEDSEGFDGRRPLKDPFRVGEKVTLDVTYFKIKAGEIDLLVSPFVEVNGKKAYSFDVALKTYSLFNRIFSLDDKAKTYVDYETLRPHNLSITLKQSSQLAETRTLFDWEKNKATYWRKKYTKEKGEENKEVTWDILPYSQNLISGLFYLRTFQMRPGKKFSFRVADEGKNIVFTAEVLRREVIDTKEGKLNTLVLKPSIEVDGAYKAVGQNLVWLTDDDRKFIVRMELELKIGTLVARLKTLKKE